MTIAVDGHANGTSSASTTVSASLTTANATDVVIALVGAAGGSGNVPNFPGMQLSDAGGKVTNWQLQYEVLASNGNSMQVWWGTTSATMSANSITATFKTAQTRASLVVWGVSGANLSSPFDTNASIIASIKLGANFGATGVTNAFSTSCTNAMVICCGMYDGGAVANSPSAGFTSIDVSSSTGGNVGAVQHIVAATQSSITPSWTSIGSGSVVGMGFAIAAAGETLCSAVPPAPLFEGTEIAQQSTSQSTIAATVTTNQSGDMVIAVIGRSANVAVTGIASANTTGWVKYTTFNQSTDIYVDVWTGTATGKLTAESITATFASAVATSAMILAGVVAGNPSAPFDGHAGLPATNGGPGFSAMTSGAGTTTGTAITALVVSGQAGNSPPNTSAQPPTVIAGTNNGAHVNVGMYAEPRSAALSSTTYSVGTNGSGDWEVGVMALTLASIGGVIPLSTHGVGISMSAALVASLPSLNAGLGITFTTSQPQNFPVAKIVPAPFLLGLTEAYNSTANKILPAVTFALGLGVARWQTTQWVTMGASMALGLTASVVRFGTTLPLPAVTMALGIQEQSANVSGGTTRQVRTIVDVGT